MVKDLPVKTYKSNQDVVYFECLLQTVLWLERVESLSHGCPYHYLSLFFFLSIPKFKREVLLVPLGTFQTHQRLSNDTWFYRKVIFLKGPSGKIEWWIFTIIVVKSVWWWMKLELVSLETWVIFGLQLNSFPVECDFVSPSERKWKKYCLKNYVSDVISP